MKMRWLILFAPLLLHAGNDAPVLSIRGRPQTVTLLTSPRGHDKAVLFLPGDGGWRGLAVEIGQTVSQWGYDVYGFDTKRYLEEFSQGGAKLSAAEMRDDLQKVTEWVRSRGAKDVTLLGWSQGAAMAVLAAQGEAGPERVITLGLPETGVLGWNWKDTLAVAARREPDEPHFAVKPILGCAAAIPLWMIHGSRDEYTSPEAAAGLYAIAGAPKRWMEIEGANHRFDGHRGELYRALRAGLAWPAGPAGAAKRTAGCPVAASGAKS